MIFVAHRENLAREAALDGARIRRADGESFGAAIPDFVAINSAFAVDLFGQSTAESVNGSFRTSGAGQMDYVRAARLAPRGRSIIMLASTGGKDRSSRIVPSLAAGDLITSHRADVDFVVTEYGVADLRLTSLKQRAQRLIAVAHPDHREMLERL